MDDKFLYLANAREDILGAQSELAYKRFNNAANRAYYTCFHAAIAALLDAGIRAPGDWGHSFVQAQFNGILVRRRKLYLSELGIILPKNERTRLNADYAASSVSEQDAQRTCSRAAQFVELVIKKVDGVNP